MTDHNVYIWEYGWKTFSDSRCYFRKGHDVVSKATASGIGIERFTSEQGTGNEATLEVQFPVASIPTRGIKIGDKVEVLQPITGTDKDWQKFRVGGTKIMGGLMAYTLETEYEQTQ